MSEIINHAIQDKLHKTIGSEDEVKLYSCFRNIREIPEDSEDSSV
jgi:hypothetical protein